jgi:hypothetical protein
VRRREKVFLILKEEILSQQQTKEKTGGSPYPKGRNPLNNKPRRMFSYPKGRNSLSTTNQGEDGRRFSLS